MSKIELQSKLYTCEIAKPVVTRHLFVKPCPTISLFPILIAEAKKLVNSGNPNAIAKVEIELDLDLEYVHYVVEENLPDLDTICQLSCPASTASKFNRNHLIFLIFILNVLLLKVSLSNKTFKIETEKSYKTSYKRLIKKLKIEACKNSYDSMFEELKLLNQIQYYNFANVYSPLIEISPDDNKEFFFVKIAPAFVIRYLQFITNYKYITSGFSNVRKNNIAQSVLALFLDLNEINRTTNKNLKNPYIETVTQEYLALISNDVNIKKHSKVQHLLKDLYALNQIGMFTFLRMHNNDLILDLKNINKNGSINHSEFKYEHVRNSKIEYKINRNIRFHVDLNYNETYSKNLNAGNLKYTL